jgi:transcriptional regulator with XRE-family HTH domain
MMATTPRLLRHATVTPGAGGNKIPPAPTIRQIVCENIRIACIHNEVRRKQLAAMLGIGYAATAGIWHGTRNMSTEDLWTISQAFEIPVHRFFVYHDVDDWDWLHDDRRRTEARQAVVRSLHELAAQLEDCSEKETHNG